MENNNSAIRTTYLSIIGNTLLALIKGLAGVLGNSYALIADAIESTTDIFSSVLVLIGLKYAAKPADESHPYGHGKAEPLITFLVVAFLIISAGVIAYQSVIHIMTPHKTPRPFTLIVLGGIIVSKEIFYRVVSKKGEETDSTALKADAWHHRSDALTSLAAFIGISIALIFGQGYETADDWAALLAAGLIIFNAYKIFRPALGEVMDEHRYDEMIEEVRQISLKVHGVIATEKCFIRKSGMSYFVDLHMIVDANIPVYEGHEIAHKLKDTILEQLPQIENVFIHTEPAHAPSPRPGRRL